MVISTGNTALKLRVEWEKNAILPSTLVLTSETFEPEQVARECVNMYLLKHPFQRISLGDPMQTNAARMSNG